MNGKKAEALEQEKKHLHVAAAIIYKEEEDERTGAKRKMVFATERGYGPLAGGWEFPGGKLEPGETPEEALVREILEELDTVIRVEEYVDRVEYEYDDFFLTMDCYMCSVVEGDLVLKEHSDAAWLTKENLDSVKWLPADVSLIEKLRETL